MKYQKHFGKLKFGWAAMLVLAATVCSLSVALKKAHAQAVSGNKTSLNTLSTTSSQNKSNPIVTSPNPPVKSVQPSGASLLNNPTQSLLFSNPNLAQIVLQSLPPLYSQTFCSQRYNYCVNECLGRAAKASPDELTTPCSILINPNEIFATFGHKYGYEFCEAKQYLCRYGQCNSDHNCAASDAECQGKIQKVVANLDCHLNETEKNCGEAMGDWGAELQNNYGELFNFIFSRLGLVGLYLAEFPEKSLEDVPQDLPSISCITSCWTAPYTASDDPAKCAY